MKTTNVIGTPCANTSAQGLLSHLEELTSSPQDACETVDFTNVHIAAMRRTNKAFRELTDQYDLFVPDSQVLKWALNLRGGDMKRRVYGPDFLRYAIEHTKPKTRHYFLGASQECLNLLIEKTSQRRPEFNLVGYHNGYFNPATEGEPVVADINEKAPDIVWVGLGTPRQQDWIIKNRHRIPRGALLAVGFAFDVNAGTKKDAPKWMQKAGLAWLFRLASEPRRLFTRYFYYNSVFLVLFFLQLTRLKRFPPPAAKEVGSWPEPDVLEQPPVNIQGVGLTPLNLDTAEEAVFRSVDDGRQGYVCVTSVHGVSVAQSDAAFKNILNHAIMCTPDGMPMVWYGKLDGRSDMSRVYGPDLMLRICQGSPKRGIKHFFFGGREGVAEQLKEKLMERYPGLEVVGTYTPPFRPLTEAEEIEVRDQVNASGADCVWVGLSTPKQERFMSGFLEKYGAEKGGDGSLQGSKIFFGVGAAFDFHSGRVMQAPYWMQRSGLEWFYRLCQEPRRLWKRYSRNNPLFLWRAFLQLTHLRKYSLNRKD